MWEIKYLSLCSLRVATFRNEIIIRLGGHSNTPLLPASEKMAFVKWSIWKKPILHIQVWFVALRLSAMDVCSKVCTWNRLGNGATSLNAGKQTGATLPSCFPSPKSRMACSDAAHGEIVSFTSQMCQCTKHRLVQYDAFSHNGFQDVVWDVFMFNTYAFHLASSYSAHVVLYTYICMYCLGQAVQWCTPALRV